MEFNSLVFILLLFPIYIGLMYFIKNNNSRNIITLLYSLIFYYFGDFRYFVLLLLVVLLTFYFGKIMTSNSKKVYYFSYLFIIVSMLSFFKYGNYLMNGALSFLNNFNIESIIMPLGVSFYTFISISYVSDCYYGKIKPENNLLNIAAFISYFPTIVSGPILRYSNFKSFLDKKEVTSDTIATGLRRFIIGLFKKVVISNQLAIIVTATFDPNALLSFPLAWLGAFVFMLQLYYDFSSYSDMAIAIASMVGFTIPENFNDPYMSLSIQDFWRRWHISLGSWFRDYVYIPLGGSRVSFIRWLFNIACVWALTGIWHGSTINYLLWGLYNGFLLVLHKLVISKIKLPKFISWVITQGMVMFGFLIFRVTSLYQLKQFIKGMIFKGPAIDMFYIKSLDIHYLWLYILIATIFVFPIFKKAFYSIEKKVPLLYDLLLIGLLVISLVFIVSGSYSSFIYAGF